MSQPNHDTLRQMRERARARRESDAALRAIIGEKAADLVAATVGSWRFIVIQSTLLGLWIVFNALSPQRFDPFPFILLNLLLSFQAAYTAPIIMMSQNRQSEIDRRRSIQDYEVNLKAELEIETLHEKIDLLREREIAALTASVERLTRMLESAQEERRPS